MRLTHTMWGGRFNPIVFVDQPEEARQAIEVFRAGLVISVGTAEEVTNFPAQFPHLITGVRERSPDGSALSYPAARAALASIRLRLANRTKQFL